MLDKINIESHMKLKVMELIKQESFIFKKCSNPYFGLLCVSNTELYCLQSEITFEDSKLDINSYLDFRRGDLVEHSFWYSDIKCIKNIEGHIGKSKEELRYFCSSFSSEFKDLEKPYLYLYNDIELESISYCFNVLPICGYEEQRLSLLKYNLYHKDNTENIDYIKIRYEFDFLWGNSKTFRELFLAENSDPFYSYTNNRNEYINLFKISLF